MTEFNYRLYLKFSKFTVYDATGLSGRKRMNILLISQCSKNALKTTRRILDQFAERCGERTWQTPITEAGLDTLHRMLRETARKNTAVACYWTRGRNRTELLWIVGDRRQFNAQGRVPTNRSRRDILRSDHETEWRHGTSIQIAATLAALLHDLGKATGFFQNKLKTRTPSTDHYRHEWLSLRLFQAMIKGCRTDAEWLGRLKNWPQYLAKHPYWYKNFGASDKNPKGDYDFTFPPLARWIAWLIVSHHRLPFYPNYPDYDHPGNVFKKGWEDARTRQTVGEFFKRLEPADRWVRNSAAKINKTSFFSLQADPTTSPLWQKQAAFWADRALQHRPLTEWCEQNQDHSDTPADPLLLHLSRLCLMAGDHNYSALPPNNAGRLKGVSELYANTDKDKEKRPKQKLDEHLCGVAKLTARFARLLPLLPRELPALGNHRPFRKPTANPRFQWQNKAFDLSRRFQTASAKQGFFGVNLASTGCGKTLANARIMYALSDPDRGARFTIALGLRVLTLQTGLSLRQRLELEENESLATLVGGGAAKELFARRADDSAPEKENEPTPEETGSESAEGLLDSKAFTDISDCPIDDKIFGTLIADTTARRLLHTPVVTCTVDHLMQLCEQQRGGRYIVPMLRLLGSDLVLDEPDDFSTEDLPALSRLVYWAGLLGSRVLLSSATLTPDMVIGLRDAYRDGRRIWNEHQGLPQEPVVCAWFDEFDQHIDAYRREEFIRQHEAFCRNRSEKLAAQPVRRRAEWLDIDSTDPETLAAKLLERASTLHRRHSQTDPASGKNISVGLIRFANINPMVKYAQAMFGLTPPDDTALHIACYHSQQLLLLRSNLERRLDTLLDRKDPAKLFTHRDDIQTALAQSPAKNHIFIVFGSPVTEVGRDHDYDWAIIEPSSMRSLIQLCGRVWRHRPHLSAAEHANIAILSRNIKALTRSPEEPAYYRPGFESKNTMLSSHDAQTLISSEETGHINSIPRLYRPMPSEKPKPRSDSLTELEHRVMADILNNPQRFTALYRQPGNAAPLTAHHAKISPFRSGRPQTDYVAFWDAEDEKIAFKTSENAEHYGGSKDGRDTEVDFKLTAAPSPTAAVFPWLCQSLPDALAKEADGDTPEALAAAAQKYAVVSLDTDSEKWRYNEWSGFWHDTEQT